MKFFIVLAVVMFVAGAQAVTDEQRKKAENHVKLCVKETGVNPELVQKMKTGDFTDKSEPIQCFAKCFFVQAQFMDAEGNFQETIVKNKLAQGADKATIDALVDGCKNESGANTCETAHKIYECYYKNKYHIL